MRSLNEIRREIRILEEKKDDLDEDSNAVWVIHDQLEDLRKELAKAEKSALEFWKEK